MEVGVSGCIACPSDLYDRTNMAVDTVCVNSNQPYNLADNSELPKVTTPSNKVDSNVPIQTSTKSEHNTKEPPPLSPLPISTNPAKYRLLRTIGKGNFAKVKLAIHIATGVELKREITIMKTINHPNIVKLLEIIENEDVLCLVMEYASGVSNGKMCEKEARNKFRQLLSSIQYCHAKKIVHRDLKAENILLDKHLNVKVADFGLANTFESDQLLKTFCGSPPYAAPELFLGIPYYGPGVDVWSLGVILFTLVLGHLPFDARDLRELRNKILNLHYSIPRAAISPECEVLLRKMLVFDPKIRSSLKSLMQDKWVNMGYAPSEYLRPYKEPPKSQLDEIRVEAMESMGYSREHLELSVVNPEFDHIYATYNLLPESPSQLIELCEDLTKISQNHPSTLSSAMSTLKRASLQSNEHQENPNVPKGGATAIGRFTVVPSVKTTDQPNASNTHGPRGQIMKTHLPPTDPAYNREHHSLTSNLPVALKRALLQVGRTLGGGSASPSAGGANVIGPVDAQNVKPVRSSVRTAVKPNGTRNVITAAPVPMSTMNKKNFPTVQQKRLSVNQHGTVSPNLHSNNQEHIDSNSLTVPASAARSVAQHAKQLTNVRSVTNSTSSTPKREVHDMKSGGRGKVGADSSQRSHLLELESVKLSMKQQQQQHHYHHYHHQQQHQHHPQQQQQQATSSHHQTHVQQMGSSNTSSTYSADDTTERNDGTTVLDLIVSNTPSTPHRDVSHKPRTSNSLSECTENALQSTSATPPLDLKYEDGGQKSANFESAVSTDVSLSFTDIVNPKSAESAVSRNWGADSFEIETITKTAIPNESIKASHTVQGNEATALRDQILRLRSTNSATPPSMSPPGPTN